MPFLNDPLFPNEPNPDFKPSIKPTITDTQKYKDFEDILNNINKSALNIQSFYFQKNPLFSIKGISIEDLNVIKAYLKNREETISQKDSLLKTFYDRALKKGTSIDNEAGYSFSTPDFAFGRDYRYIDYEMMDAFTPEISAALDAYAEYIIQSDSKTKQFFEIKEINENFKNIDKTIYNKIIKEFFLFIESLGINKSSFLTNLVRETFKFGDSYLLLDFHYDENGNIMGIKHVQYLSPINIKIIYHPVSKQIICYEYYPYKNSILAAGNQAITSSSSLDPAGGSSALSPVAGSTDITSTKYVYTPLEILHIKFNEGKFAPYGTSLLEPIRRTWKQLIMLEDMMTVYRINHSIDRRIVYVDVSDLPREEALEYLREVEILMNKKANVDLANIAVDGRDWITKAHSVNEVLYIPTRGGNSNAGISFGKLEGLSPDQFEADLKYLQDKLFSKLKIPKSFLTYDKDVNAKATLIEENKAFTKIILNYQDIFAEYIWQLFQLDKWFKNELQEVINFKLVFGAYSYLSEKEYIENLKDKIDVAKDLIELKWTITKTTADNQTTDKNINLVKPEFILRKILGLPEKDIIEILNEIEKNEADVKTENMENTENIEKNNEESPEEERGGFNFNFGGGEETEGGEMGGEETPVTGPLNNPGTFSPEKEGETEEGGIGEENTLNI